MTTIEMIKALTENPKRKASFTENEETLTVFVKDNVIRYVSEDMYHSKLCSIRINDNRNWTIIEPDPEPVDFKTAFKAYYRDNYPVKSVVTGNKYCSIFSRATDEEIDGMWIIDNR